jgi:hypothetical protein
VVSQSVVRLAKPFSFELAQSMNRERKEKHNTLELRAMSNILSAESTFILD